MTTYYLRLELVRMLRDARYLALAVGAPIGFYLLFATLFGGNPVPPGQLPGNTEIMVAMAAYGAIWAVLSATGPRISAEREVGWFRQVRAMPVPAPKVLLAKVTASLALALPALILVDVTGAIVKGVRMDAWQWTAMTGAMWAGSIPFAALGLAIGYAVSADASFALSYGIYVAMSAVGGLWVPPSVLPAGMQSVAHALPSYQLGELGWRIAAGHPPTLTGVAVLAAWAAGASGLAAMAYARPRLTGRAKVAPAIAGPGE
jgi:ABC-2 type transport system permease protein